MSEPTIPEGVVRFTHALVEDASLRSWFFDLARLTSSLRASAFGQMAQQMGSDGEDPELAAAAATLVRPEMYDAVLKAVRERCELR